MNEEFEVTGERLFKRPEMKKDGYKLGDKINFADSMYDALKNADALIISTEWSIFRTPDFSKMKTVMSSPTIFDGRNLYEPVLVERKGFTYYAIGRGENQFQS